MYKTSYFSKDHFALKYKIKIKFNEIMNYFGYYKTEDLQIYGHCGICGKAINGVFPKDWPIGICDKCKNIEK